MMIRTCLTSLATVQLLLSLGGCASGPQVNVSSPFPLELASRSNQADRMWLAIQETLRKSHYRLDRVDRRAGVITTMPENSQHFFEFWRRDVATTRDFWEATLNPIRRRIEVSVAVDGDQWRSVSVAVFKQRFSSADRQFNSTGAAYQFFAKSLPSTTGQYSVETIRDKWIDMGRDEALERRLLALLLDRAGIAQTEPSTESDRT